MLPYLHKGGKFPVRNHLLRSYAVSKIPSVISMSMGRAKQRLMAQRLKQQKRQIQSWVRDAKLLQTRGKKGIQGLQGSGGLSTEKPCRILLGFTFSAISASPCVIWHLHTIHLNLKFVCFLNPFGWIFGAKWRRIHKSLVNSAFYHRNIKSVSVHKSNYPWNKSRKQLRDSYKFVSGEISLYYPHQNGS